MFLLIASSKNVICQGNLPLSSDHWLWFERADSFGHGLLYHSSMVSLGRIFFISSTLIKRPWSSTWNVAATAGV